MKSLSFDEKVWALCSQIPKGRVTTYKIIADKMGTRAYRAVGQALRRNPHAPKVPCHRVVASDFSLGGYDGKMNSKRKIKLLKKEGVDVKEMKKIIYNF